MSSDMSVGAPQIELFAWAGGEGCEQTAQVNDFVNYSCCLGETRESESSGQVKVMLPFPALPNKVSFIMWTLQTKYSVFGCVGGVFCNME